MADEDTKVDYLPLVKANLGRTNDKRDSYLQSLIDAVQDELTDKGLTFESLTAQMLLVDWVAWRFRNRGEGTLPRNLQYRLHNLIIKNTGSIMNGGGSSE